MNEVTIPLPRKDRTPTTKKDYSIVYAPKNLALQLRGKKAPIQLCQLQEPMIRELLQQIPEEKVSALIELQFLELDNFLQLKNGLSEKHLIFIAQGIIDEFSEFTLLDIAFFIRQIKMGTYGEFFNRMNPTKVFLWLKAYKQERLKAQQQYEVRKKKAQEQAEEKQRQQEWEALSPEEKKAIQHKKIELIKSLRGLFTPKD